MVDTPRHSVSVAGIVVNSSGQILTVKRRDNGEWQPPGGVLELDETIEEGLRREIREETGIETSVGHLTGIYQNMSLGVIALVFRCSQSGGKLHVSEESEQVSWMTLEQVDAVMTPVFAVRVRDAINEIAPVKLRSHDGTGRL